MAENKKSFIAYADWKDTFEALPDDKAGQLIKHIFSYVSDENPKSDDVLINAVFANIKHALKRDLKKWDHQREQRVLAGKRSAEKRQRNATSVNERSISSTVNVNDNVSVNVNVKDNKNIKQRKAEFYNSLSPYLDKYSKSMVKDFAEYWTEHGVNDKKMRFEKQRSFGVERRLSTWLKNEKKFSAESTGNRKPISLAEKMKKDYGLS